MKKILIILFLSLFCATIEVDAHSGRTDSSGGHNCSEKSIQKGLCTGYHNHNNGTSTKQSSTKSNVSSDKNCSDFSSYEEVIAYWNQKGYSATYDPENLDGWGKNVVDDGIPCEPPSGYDLSKVNNSSYQITARDQERGSILGAENGYADGYANEQANTEVEGSIAYQNAYTAHYKKMYTEGQNQFFIDRQAAYDQGKTLGYSGEIYKLPEQMMFEQQFLEGYQSGIQQLIEKNKREYEKAGVADGYQNQYQLDTSWIEEYQEAYRKGFVKGIKKLEQEVKREGYQAAFLYDSFKEIDLTNVPYISWFEAGYDSNKLAIKMKESAYQLGYENEPYEISKEFKLGEDLYRAYYEKGYEERPTVNKWLLIIGSACVIIILAFLYRFFRRK